MTEKKLTDVVFKLSYDLGAAFAGHPALADIHLGQVQMRVLRFVLNAGETTPIDIARALKRDKGQVTRLLQELDALGMVTRIPNPKDGRSKLIVLTDAARDVFRVVQSVEEPIFKAVTQGVSPEALTQFFAVAQQISDNLQALDPPET